MKFIKYCLSLFLVCVALSYANGTVDGEKILHDSFIGGLPVLASMAGVTFTGPIAPIIVGSLLTIQLASTIISSEKSGTESLTKTEFLEKQAKINNQLSTVTSKISNMAFRLKDVAETNEFFENMRNDLDELQSVISDNWEVVLNPYTFGILKTFRMKGITNYFSKFRQNLKSFVSKYIKPKTQLESTGDINLFYEFILRRQKNAIENGDDCYTESVHTQLLKSFMYIIKTLSDAYALVISAHTMQYEQELWNNRESALDIQKNGQILIDQYKSDMKALMEKTKWGLKEASRDVRRCGTFERLQKGDTFDRVPFAYILPKFNDWAHNETVIPLIGPFMPKFQCFPREQDVKHDDFHIAKCGDFDISTPAGVTVFVDPNAEWPYVSLKNEPTLGRNRVYGTNIEEDTGLIVRKIFHTNTCFSVYCNAYRKNVVGVSTKVVAGNEGTVITGARFAVRSNIIYIDVQVGKVLNDLSVDPTTLTWVQTPPSDEVLYLNPNITKFELGDIEVPGNDSLRTIQFQLKNKDEGIIGLLVNGGVSESQQNAPKSNELVLQATNIPEFFGNGTKNLVSKAPVLSEPYHVSLQPSDFDNNLGGTTVPYFDIREVITNPAAPLAGIGLYHQTIEGSGGFISLKLKQLDLSPFVDYSFVEKIVDSISKIK